mmetsp:Transcript_17928/g.29993  ORF Transcript_17928/g.29993 Transcript_17928/m.29993 type:complete len:217 (+) Transcript_17928:71-721(+)
MLGDSLLAHDHDQSTSTTASRGTDSDQQSTPSSPSQRWKDLPLNLLSFIPLVLGLIHWNDCSSIPLLTWYLVIFGGVNVVRTVVSFVWNVPRDVRLMNKELMSAKIIRILGLLVIAIAVFGTVLTLRDVGDNFPSGGNNCTRVAYLSALFSSVCTVLIVALILLVVLTRKCMKKCHHKSKKHRDIRFFYESYHSSDGSDDDDDDSSFTSDEDVEDK